MSEYFAETNKYQLIDPALTPLTPLHSIFVVVAVTTYSDEVKTTTTTTTTTTTK